MVEDLPLYTGLTPAMFVGRFFDLANALVVFGLILLALNNRRRR